MSFLQLKQLNPAGDIEINYFYGINNFQVLEEKIIRKIKLPWSGLKMYSYAQKMTFYFVKNISTCFI